MSATGHATHPGIVTLSDLGTLTKEGKLCAALDLTIKGRYRISANYLPAYYSDTASPISSRLYANSYELGLALNFGKPDKWNFFIGGTGRLFQLKVEDYTESGTIISTAGFDYKFLIPTIHSGLELKIGKRFAILGEVKLYSWKGNSLNDFSGTLKFRLIKALSVALGYRALKFNYTTDSLQTEVSLAGPFFMAGLNF